MPRGSLAWSFVESGAEPGLRGAGQGRGGKPGLGGCKLGCGRVNWGCWGDLTGAGVGKLFWGGWKAESGWGARTGGSDTEWGAEPGSVGLNGAGLEEPNRGWMGRTGAGAGRGLGGRTGAEEAAAGSGLSEPGGAGAGAGAGRCPWRDTDAEGPGEARPAAPAGWVCSAAFAKLRGRLDVPVLPPLRWSLVVPRGAGGPRGGCHAVGTRVASKAGQTVASCHLFPYIKNTNNQKK